MGASRVQAVLDASESGQVCRVGAIDAAEGAAVGRQLSCLGGSSPIKRQAKSSEGVSCGAATTVTTSFDACAECLVSNSMVISPYQSQ